MDFCLWVCGPNCFPGSFFQLAKRRIEGWFIYGRRYSERKVIEALNQFQLVI